MFLEMWSKTGVLSTACITLLLYIMSCNRSCGSCQLRYFQ